MICGALVLMQVVADNDRLREELRIQRSETMVARDRAQQLSLEAGILRERGAARRLQERIAQVSNGVVGSRGGAARGNASAHDSDTVSESRVRFRRREDDRDYRDDDGAGLRQYDSDPGEH